MSCTYRNIYLESDEFYQICLHLLSCIQVPLHILGSFIILKKTPKTMGRVKGSMLTLHLLTAWLDIFLTVMMIPFIIWPIFSVYPLGLLYYLGFSVEVMTYIGYATFCCVVTSIMLFFENRYNYLVRHDSESPSRKINRATNYILNYSFSFLIVLAMFYGTKGVENYREIAHQKLQCLPSEILEKPKFFMFDINFYIAIPCICFYACIELAQMFFYFSATSYHLYRTKAQSTRILRMQKQFFQCLCVQISVPIISFLFPCLYILYSVISNSFDMTVAVFVMLGISTHGLVSTTIMLFAHKPYREATLDISGFRGRNRMNAASFIVAKTSISNVK